MHQAVNDDREGFFHQGAKLLGDVALCAQIGGYYVLGLGSLFCAMQVAGTPFGSMYRELAFTSLGEGQRVNDLLNASLGKPLLYTRH